MNTPFVGRLALVASEASGSTVPFGTSACTGGYGFFPTEPLSTRNDSLVRALLYERLPHDAANTRSSEGEWK